MDLTNEALEATARQLERPLSDVKTIVDTFLAERFNRENALMVSVLERERLFTGSVTDVGGVGHENTPVTDNGSNQGDSEDTSPDEEEAVPV